MVDLKALIRSISDFPRKGIVFRDITTLLKDPAGLAEAVNAMAAPFALEGVEQVVGAESRGFILGSPIAIKLGAGFVPVRKPGKLPADKLAETYQLEYGTDSIEIHLDAIRPGAKVLLVDDLLATGGTMEACARLVEKLGGRIVGISFLIELSFLNGRSKLTRYPVYSLINYESE